VRLLQLHKSGARRHDHRVLLQGGYEHCGAGRDRGDSVFAWCHRFQPEPELAYVIGKRAKHVSQAEALEYVFGYVILIDVSARGIRGRRTPFLHKGIDDWAPQGPVLVTKDEIEDPMNLRVRLWLNGEPQQDYSTAAMTHSIVKQIKWLSQYVTLMPGDVVACETHHEGLCNVNDGDHVEMEVEGLERLSVEVLSHAPKLTERWRPAGVAP
jgi:2-keto-4-pentenoate hydratase/2-oxohepta-3-ene-1,7-dioic acid hydratase in catechol pathway